MLTLREIQRGFTSVLFDTGAGSFAREILHDGIDGAARLGIYRNNLHEGFIKALTLEFPVIVRLVGTDYFRQLALEFLAAHPSRAGDLHHVGTALSRYLGERLSGTEYAYLCDVAALEWAWQEVLVAPDSPTLHSADLGDVAPAEYGNLKFRLHPAVRLVSSLYPILQIWKENQPGSPAEATIDLASSGDRVLVLRGAQGITLQTLAAGEFALLECFDRDFTLAAAFEAAGMTDPSFDLGAALRRFVPLGAFASARISNPLAP